MYAFEKLAAVGVPVEVGRVSVEVGRVSVEVSRVSHTYVNEHSATCRSGHDQILVTIT